jgi:hypothetical protein
VRKDGADDDSEAIVQVRKLKAFNAFDCGHMPNWAKLVDGEVSCLVVIELALAFRH